MTKTLLPQHYCQNSADHPTHTVWPTATTVTIKPYRCPGRNTPSRYRAPDPQPRPGWTDDDPFAGLDD